MAWRFFNVTKRSGSLKHESEPDRFVARMCSSRRLRFRGFFCCIEFRTMDAACAFQCFETVSIAMISSECATLAPATNVSEYKQSFR